MPHHHIIRSLVLTAVFGLALAPGQAHARPEQAAHAAAARFEAMDANKDGTVSREEFFAAQPQMKDAAFDAIDADKDGRITLQEWEGFSVGHGKGDAHAAGEGMPPHDAGGPNAAGGASAPPTLLAPPAASPE